MHEKVGANETIEELVVSYNKNAIIASSESGVSGEEIEGAIEKAEVAFDEIVERTAWHLIGMRPEEREAFLEGTRKILTGGVTPIERFSYEQIAIFSDQLALTLAEMLDDANLS